MITAKRGVSVSIDSWKVAVDHAESLVVLAENKVDRLNTACAVKVAKLQVSVCLSCIANCLQLTHFIPAQARNDSFKKNEEAAYEILCQNNIMIRKVGARPMSLPIPCASHLSLPYYS